MRAMKGKDVLLDKLKFPLWAQLKYDGVRLITIIENGKVSFTTFNNNIVPLPHLENKVKVLNNIILDGEIVLHSGVKIYRTTVSGMINSAMHGGQINESILNYILFDTMSIKDFNKKSCNEPYKQRYEKVIEIAIRTRLITARNTTVYSIKEVEKLTEHMYKDGYEGLILKPPMHMYKFGRSNDWAKIKEVKTTDLKCISVKEGTGKYECMIGALLCEGLVEGKNVKVFVGSGLSDAQRALPLNTYLGKTIEVKYNTVTQDSNTSQWSLFLPRFVCIRFDK